MLPFPAAGGLMLPAKAQLTTAALPKYRELLRKTRSSSGGPEESSSLFQQAKERVLLRLRERRGTARIDPRRAFSRLQERADAARLSLRVLKNEQKERLRQYYATAVAGSKGLPSNSPTAAVAGSERQHLAAASAAASVLDARAAQAALGTNGPLRHLVLAGVGGACKLFLTVGARTTIQGQEHMAAALARAPGRGLITVSNHVGSIDDPLVTSAIVPASKLLLDPSAVRWTMCATDRCFKSAALVPFFRAGKVLPVERGAGLSQVGMQLAQSRLLAGEWVHIFPEGTRSRDGRMLPVRRGVGWLVASAAASGQQPPLVLPFVHSGMENILPKGKSLPKLGQQLHVLVGEPVAVEDLLVDAAQQAWSQEHLQMAIADRVGKVLYQLKAQLDNLPLEAVVPQPQAAAIGISEDTLLPMIEDEMDSLAHRWQDKWQRLSLPSLTQRMRQAVAAHRAGDSGSLADSIFSRSGSGNSGGAGGMGADASFQQIAAATEETAGIISGWEHADAAPIPWGGTTATDAGVWAPGDPAADAPATTTAAAAQARLVIRQKLLMLRGSMLQAATALRGESSSSGSSSTVISIPRTEAPPASPLDGVPAAGAAGCDDGSSGGARLLRMLAAAADYSAARVQHMRQLLERPSPDASSLAAMGSI